jgi:hypothetical protein
MEGVTLCFEVISEALIIHACGLYNQYQRNIGMFTKTTDPGFQTFPAPKVVTELAATLDSDALLHIHLRKTDGHFVFADVNTYAVFDKIDADFQYFEDV